MKLIVWMGMALIAISTGCAVTPDTGRKVKTPAEDKPYPFSFCIVSGEELLPGREPYIVRHEGQIYRLCCKDCLAQFKNDPAPHVEKFKELLELREQSSGGAGG